MSAAGSADSPQPEKNKAGRPRRTDWQEPFLEHFRSHGVQAWAAAASGVSVDTVGDERKRAPEFAAAYGEAYEASTAALEFAGYRWASVGLPAERTVTRERRELNEKGELVVTMRETTTTVEVDRNVAMTIFMLKARRPDVYRERLALEGGGEGAAPVAIEVTKEEADTAVERFSSAVASLAARRAAREGAQAGGAG